jgi:hypothetical protein
MTWLPLLIAQMGVVIAFGAILAARHYQRGYTTASRQNLKLHDTVIYEKTQHESTLRDLIAAQRDRLKAVEDADTWRRAYEQAASTVDQPETVTE